MSKSSFPFPLYFSLLLWKPLIVFSHTEVHNLDPIDVGIAFPPPENNNLCYPPATTCGVPLKYLDPVRCSRKFLSLIPISYLAPFTGCDISLGFYQHTAKYGDICDPDLVLLYRRLLDDQQTPKNPNEPFGMAISAIPPHPEISYNGYCSHICPQMMCVSVSSGVIDRYTLDCVKTTYTNQYDRHIGSCTCGHLMSFVDPVTMPQEQVSKVHEIKYKATIGLDMKLIWDDKMKKCNAGRYGHCSFKWDPKRFRKETWIYCAENGTKCVNESGSVVGAVYRNFKMLDGRWWGICDFTDTKNPFKSEGEGVKVKGHCLLMIIILLSLIVKFLVKINLI